MVEGGKGDVDHVDVCVVQHVLHAAIGAHVGKIALNDVAALLHQVAHRRDGVELRQLAKCGQMVQQTGSAQARDAYAEMVRDSRYTENKELMIIPGAVHTDLYDQVEIIPFDKLEGFFKEYLK